MLPFGTPATLTCDHRTMGLEFDHDVLFGQKVPHSDYIIRRGVYSNAYPTVRKFNDDIAQACEKQGLFQAAQQLSNHYTLTLEDHNELERIDKALTQILTSTGQRYAWYKNSPCWSPELHQTFLEHCYWQMELTQKRTRRNYTRT